MIINIHIFVDSLWPIKEESFFFVNWNFDEAFNFIKT